ncbi:MAG: rhomboid family intramembrane serine protease [Halobacteriales archaeon]
MRVVYWVAIALALVGTLLLLARLDPTVARINDRLRRRWLLGVPWGTLVSVALVVVVYLFVQDGISQLRAPVTLPFRAWSYAYPTGWLTAGFAHSDLGHLEGNLTAAIVLGSLAEYAVGHYPTERGAITFSSWRTNPYVRAFVLVPAAVVGAGLFTSLFAIGPVIGFSSVVFAFAGVALVRFPLATLVGVLGYRALRTLVDALRSPELVSGISQPPPSQPWWSEVAIQGHAIGLLLGLLVGIAIFRRRGTLASPWRVWTATVLFAITQSLWAVYWFEGADTFRLFQGLGLVLVVVLAGLVAATAAGGDRPLLRGWSRRQLAVGTLVLGLIVLSAPAVPVNLVKTDPGPAAEYPGLEVADYRVIYAEDVENELVTIVDTGIVDLGDVRTSGVIVASERRDIWFRVVSRERLDEFGVSYVHLGGVGWRETVSAHRDDWSVAGNGSVYQVWLHDDDRRVHAFASPPRRAEAVVANRTVTIGVENESFVATVERDGESLDTVAIPSVNATVDVAGVTLRNDEGTLRLEHDGTSVPVAARGD